MNEHVLTDPVSEHPQRRGRPPFERIALLLQGAVPSAHIRQASIKDWQRPVFIPTGLPGFPSARSTLPS